MVFKQHSDGSLVGLISTTPLFDPFEAPVVGRFHAGEELPGCWLDPNDQRHNDSTKS
jgi:hypothetical protein